MTEGNEDEGKKNNWFSLAMILIGLGALLVCGGFATGTIGGINSFVNWINEDEVPAPVAAAVAPTSAFMFNGLPTVARTFKGVNSFRGEEEFFIQNAWATNDPNIVRNAGEINVLQCLPQIGIVTESKPMYDIGTKGQAGYVYCGGGNVYGWCDQVLPDDCAPKPTKGS